MAGCISSRTFTDTTQRAAELFRSSSLLPSSARQPRRPRVIIVVPHCVLHNSSRRHPSNACTLSALLPILVSLVVLPSGIAGARENARHRSRPRRQLSPRQPRRSLRTGTCRSVGTIDSHVLGLALRACRLRHASGAAAHASTLTVIDYSRPSTEKRLWVFDLRSRELVYEELVAHGQGSGGIIATSFRTRPTRIARASGCSSPVTPTSARTATRSASTASIVGFNDRARDRAIVMHGAPYVSEAFARAAGPARPQLGMPRGGEDVARELIDRVKGGGLVFAYYPDSDWLAASKYLGGCAAASVHAAAASISRSRTPTESGPSCGLPARPCRSASSGRR